MRHGSVRRTRFDKLGLVWLVLDAPTPPFDFTSMTLVLRSLNDDLSVQPDNKRLLFCLTQSFLARSCA
jgi:hypothetical protein